MSEYQEAKALVMWSQIEAKRRPELELLFHVPNEAETPWRRMKMASQGVKPGVPDYFLPVPRGVYGGLWIELKTEKGNLTASQQFWIERLRLLDYAVVVARGWEVAREAILTYLDCPAELVSPYWREKSA